MCVKTGRYVCEDYWNGTWKDWAWSSEDYHLGLPGLMTSGRPFSGFLITQKGPRYWGLPYYSPWCVSDWVRLGFLPLAPGSPWEACAAFGCWHPLRLRRTTGNAHCQPQSTALTNCTSFLLQQGNAQLWAFSPHLKDASWKQSRWQCPPLPVTSTFSIRFPVIHFWGELRTNHY